MAPDGQTITDRVLRNVKYCRYMYGMFGVESLAVEIIDGENRLKKCALRAFSARNAPSDQIANMVYRVY